MQAQNKDSESHLTLVDVEDARRFFRLCAPSAANAQLHHVVSNHRQQCGAWLLAALREGLLDAQDPRDLTKQHAHTKGMPAPLAMCSLTQELVAAICSPHDVAGIQYGNHPEEDLGMVSLGHSAYRPLVPLGFNEFLGEWSERLVRQYAAHREVYGAPQLASWLENPSFSQPQDCAYRGFADSASVIVLLAISMDDVDLVRRWSADAHFGPYMRAFPYVGSHPLMGSADNDQGSRNPWWHWGTVAMHFGSTACLNQLIEDGWQLASNAGRAVDNLAVVAGPRQRRMLPMSEHLASVVRISPACIARVLQEIASRGFVDDDRHWLGHHFSQRLRQAAVGHDPDLWTQLVEACGLHRHFPKQLAYEGLLSAALPLVKLVDDQVDWDNFKLESQGRDAASNPLAIQALALASGNTVEAIDEKAREIMLTWLVRRLSRQADPSTLEAVLDHTSSGMSVAEHAVISGMSSALLAILEAGLDPYRRPTYGVERHSGRDETIMQLREARSVMDACIDHGATKLEALVRSHQARQAANEVASEIAAQLQASMAP